MNLNTTLKHIVLADDDKDHGFIFGRILKKVVPDARLTLVHDGEALLTFLQAITPDLLFLDLNMPCRHGFECLETIKGSESLKNLPVIVYSSSSQMTDIQRSYINKADFYMVKPFTVSYLEEALQAVFSMDWRQPSAMQYYYINNRLVPFTAMT